MKPDESPGRAASAVIGAVFVLCAFGIFYTVPRENVPGLVCGGAILFLGVEALDAARKGRPSLLSKIGPLP